MKHPLRLADYIDHMQQAAVQAIGFVESMDKTALLDDPRTQSAVVFNINLDVVWDTVQTAIPQLLTLLPAVLDAARRHVAEGDPPMHKF